MFQFKEFMARGLDRATIESLRDSETSTIVYFYNPDATFFEHLEGLYQQDFSTLLYKEKEAQYKISKTNSGDKYVTLLLLYPKERNEEKIERMVDSLIVLNFEGLIIIITEDKEAFISEFLRKFTDKEMNSGESLVGILNAALGKMTNDAREIRDEITSLEASINHSGPSRSVFNDLLQLKKHLITLVLTYDSDDKLIEFFKREKDLLNLKTKGENGLIQLEENLDSLKKLADAYHKYLSGLDTMVNNLSSFRLNAIMKTLTEISIILTIPTMVYGFWGINLKLPFEEFPFGFLLVIGISLAISGAVWYWIKKMKFL